MAFNRDSVSFQFFPLSGGDVRLAFYGTDDDRDTVMTAGYFTDATKVGLIAGTVIFVYASGQTDHFTAKVDSIDAATDVATVSVEEISIGDVASILASQAEAETGTNNTKIMTPLRAAQHYSARLGTGVETALAKNVGVTGAPALYQDDLKALEDLSTTGIVARTATSTFVPRTITGTANEITVSNGSGVSANPTLSFPSTVSFSGKTVTLPGSGQINSSGNVGLGVTPAVRLHIKGAEGTASIIRVENTSSGATAISQTLSGIELLAHQLTATSKYTSGVKFGSTDPTFTTQNPKFLAGVFGYATELYDTDADSGMGIEFFTSPNSAGASSVPTSRGVIDQTGAWVVGANSGNAAALLQVDSTTRGFLPPRMTSTQRDAISTPPNGLMVYNSTGASLSVYAGGAWEDIPAGAVFSGVVYPVSYGAVGDGDGAGGGTDDDVALQAALDDLDGLDGYGILDLAGKTYRCDSVLTCYSNITIRNGTLDFTNVTSTSGGIIASGSDGTGLALSANALAGDVTVSLSNTGTLAVDEWVYVRDDDFFDAASAAGVGEWAKIKSIVTNTSVTFYTALLHSYLTADSAEILPRTYVENIRLENLTLIGTANFDNGFLFTNGINIVVENCNIYNFEQRLGWFNVCRDVQVINCRGGGVTEAGLTYGFVFGPATEMGLMHRCSLVDVGHGGVCGQGTAGVTRFITFSENYICSTGGGLDAHPGSEEINFLNNVVIGPGGGGSFDAFNINGRSALVQGNTIRGSSRHGILCSSEVDSAFNCRYIITDNDIESLDATDIGILVTAAECKISNSIVSDNTVNGFAQGIYLKATAANIDNNGFVVTGNAVGYKKAPATVPYILEATGGGDIGRCVVSNNFGWAAGTADYAMRLIASGGGTLARINLIGNNLTVTSGAGGNAGISASGTDYIMCIGNIIDTAGTEISVAGANSVVNFHTTDGIPGNISI